MEQPQILIVAGEESGDFYGAELVHRLSELNPNIAFFGMGGDRMESTGVELVQHIRDVAVMGFVEVLSRIGPLFRSFRHLIEVARQRRPDVAIVIDFPDYNLRLADKLRNQIGIKTVYYIGPTVWAWRRGRVETVRRAIDRMLVIFPFEEPIYQQAGVDVRYVGHPLVGTVQSRRKRAEFCRHYGLQEDVPILGLLPGSRRREVVEILPALQRAAAIMVRDRGPFQVVLGLAQTIPEDLVEGLLAAAPQVHVIRNGTHDLMRHSRVLLVASGTAPLEAALLGTPQVVAYRTTPLTYGIASRLVTVSHICMVNLILERRAVPEFVQDALEPEAVAKAAMELIDGPARTAQLEAFGELRRRLGAPGAAGRAATAVLDLAGIPVEQPPCLVP